MKEFEFENGTILEDVDVEYLIKGMPKYDDDGNISNIVVFCHGYEGSCLTINEYSSFTAEGMPLDFNEYLFISIASLGFPNSCSPSSTGLKQDFPEYNFKDKINFKKQFIKEKFGNEKVLGIIGVGMGGYEIYTWACEYPDDMKFMIVGNSSYKTMGYRYIMVKGIKSIIENNQFYKMGKYDESLSNTMITIYQFIFSMYFSQRLFKEMSNDEIDIFMEDFVEKSFNIDIYDFKFQYDALLDFNVEDKLKNVKSKALIIAPTDDFYFSSEVDAIPVKNLIDDSQVVFYDFKRNIYDEMDFTNILAVFDKFLKEIKV